MELTSGEAATLNWVFGTEKWASATNYPPLDADHQRQIASKIEELTRKTKFPGTKRYWDSAAAYHIEMLERIRAKTP